MGVGGWGVAWVREHTAYVLWSPLQAVKQTRWVAVCIQGWQLLFRLYWLYIQPEQPEQQLPPLKTHSNPARLPSSYLFLLLLHGSGFA